MQGANARGRGGMDEGPVGAKDTRRATPAGARGARGRRQAAMAWQVMVARRLGHYRWERGPVDGD